MHRLFVSRFFVKGLAYLCIAISVLSTFTAFSSAQGLLRERLKERLGQRSHNQYNTTEKVTIAGLHVAVWRPAHANGPVPLVIFSHGLCGINTQTLFLMRALSQAGYLVMAPNHRDAMGSGNMLSKPEENIKGMANWTESSYKDSGDDIKKLLSALHKDPQWNSQIDWSKLVLAGHSLGGYTMLACAGAWPSWKIPYDIKAILAMSPVTLPFLSKGTLSKVSVPIMYQGGNLDLLVTPFVKRANGAFDKTPSPACFVEFARASHFFWTDFNKDEAKQELIDHYSLAFLNKYVKGDKNSQLDEKLPGVTELRLK